MLNACSYRVATQPDAVTPLLGGLANLMEFSRNNLINTSYFSTRKNIPSKAQHWFPKSNNSHSDLLLKQTNKQNNKPFFFLGYIYYSFQRHNGNFSFCSFSFPLQNTRVQVNSHESTINIYFRKSLITFSHFLIIKEAHVPVSVSSWNKLKQYLLKKLHWLLF